MNTDQMEMNALCERVIGAAYRVSNGLGVGFLEKVYERALLVELRGLGISAEGQVPCPVLYKGFVVGEYFADLARFSHKSSDLGRDGHLDRPGMVF